MMAAYQPQPGGMAHPGMAPHAHPVMTPGQPMNPAQLQQMGHPGAVTPGPHVTQGGAMMGMQPGANAMGGPAAMGGQHPGGQMGGMPAQMVGQSVAGVAPGVNALSHMTPQAMQHQQQMMQQHIQSNPHLMQQHQLMQQRRVAAGQATGMAGMPQNAIQNMNTQQLQQLQNNQAMAHAQAAGIQLPQHLQMQQLQLQRHAQQQQAAAVQNQQMQQQMAMQQVSSQQSNQSAQAAAQNQQGGQPQHPGPPMRPQSRMADPNEQSQGGPQQNAPQNSQQGQTQQPQQQAPQQQTQQIQQGQANQQQGQQQNQQPQGQQPAMNPQQIQMMRQRQFQMQQQNALNQRLQQNAQTPQQSGQGAFILRAILFGDQLSSFDSASGKDITQWHAFVDRHFAPEGRFIHSFSWDNGNIKKYEVPRATIPRYFQMYFDSNASYVQLHLEHIREIPMQGRHQVSFSNAIFTVAYPNGARLEMAGNVKMLFGPSYEGIELMELHTSRSEEHVSRAEIERLLGNWSPTMANKTSPKMAKNKLPKAQQKLQSQYEGLTIDHFPKTPKVQAGATDRVQHFLEITETMNLMADLIGFAQERKMRPDQALDALVQQYEMQGGPGAQQLNQQGTPQINLPPNGVPEGSRTPSLQNMQLGNAQGGTQFSSPSMSNLNLPMQNGMPGMNGSPHIANNAGLAPNMNMSNAHTPSPHQANMAAPSMVPQLSQQGTNSSAASANTSPNITNKRRRSVKVEGDDAGAEGGQGTNRVKPSPRMSKKGKPGGV